MGLGASTLVVRWIVFRWREAQVDERKILEYLLATGHPVGGAKAAFFVSLGYSSKEWTRLRDDLARIARHGEVIEGHRDKIRPQDNRRRCCGVAVRPDGWVAYRVDQR